jgi:tripartite-type tricarboxylate transporter receptor subunit TctC
MTARLASALFLLTTAGALLPAPAAAQAANYPEKTIRIIVPFVAGGGSSNAARMIGEKLAERWGKPVVIDHRPGGNTVIASEAVARAAPDGHSLLYANSSFTINPQLMAKLPYDSTKDFTPVSGVLSNASILLVHPSVPANTLAEFRALLRQHPTDFPFPSVGTAGIGRVAGEVFNGLVGVSLVNVPYKGTAQLATDLVAGQVKFAIEIPGVYIPHVKAGRLKALAVTGKTRLPSLPDVPTFAEAGMPEFDLQSWNGLFATGGTPPEVVNKIAAAVQDILRSPDVRARLAAVESEPMLAGPAEFGALIRAETERFGKVIKAAKITAPN